MFRKFFIIWAIFWLPLVGCGLKTDPRITLLDSQLDKITKMLNKAAGEDGMYANDQLDFSLLDSSKTVAKQQIVELTQDYQDDKITKEVLDEGMAKGQSILFFSWMEEFDGGWQRTDVLTMNRVAGELRDFSDSDFNANWLKEKDRWSNNLKLQALLTNLSDLVTASQTIANNETTLANWKNELESLQSQNEISQYNQKVTEYNDLLETTNKLVNDYNSKLNDFSSNQLYEAFLTQIDIGYIFPGQKDLKLFKNS
jgi:hypothetical protein